MDPHCRRGDAPAQDQATGLKGRQRRGSVAQPVIGSADYLVQRERAVVQRGDARQKIVDAAQPDESTRRWPRQWLQPDPLERPERTRQMPGMRYDDDAR